MEANDVDKMLSDVGYEEPIEEVSVELFYNYDDNGKIKGISVDKFVDHLLNNFKFKTIFGIKNEVVYFYEDGIWQPVGRAKIKTEAERILGSWCKNNLVNEIVEKVKRKTEIPNKEFNEIPEGFICIDNGVFDLRKKEFLPHSEKYYFKTKLPLFYKLEADCQLVKKFFSEVLYPKDVELIQEWFGYNLYNSYFQKKAVILFGEQDTGKTITLNLLTEFLGEHNKVGLGLQKITYGKSFDLLDLKDMYANIFDDLSAKDLTDNGGFKIATGGGYIRGEVKFGEKIDFKTFAKLIFDCNKIPPVKDIDDDAYYSRWLPIAFDNQFKQDEQDKFLLKKLTDKKELSGLLNWAIEGLHRLLKNNKFTFDKSLNEVKDIMQRSSHPLAAFSQDCLEQEDGNDVSKEEMFIVYSKWCQDNTKARATKDQLGKNLLRFVPYLIQGHTGKQRVWKNVKFKDESENKKEGVSFSEGNNSSNTLSLSMSDYENSKNNNTVMVSKKPLETLDNYSNNPINIPKTNQDKIQKITKYPNNPPTKHHTLFITKGTGGRLPCPPSK